MIGPSNCPEAQAIPLRAYACALAPFAPNIPGDSFSLRPIGSLISTMSGSSTAEKEKPAPMSNAMNKMRD